MLGSVGLRPASLHGPTAINPSGPTAVLSVQLHVDAGAAACGSSLQVSTYHLLIVVIRFAISCFLPRWTATTMSADMGSVCICTASYCSYFITCSKLHVHSLSLQPSPVFSAGRRIDFTAQGLPQSASCPDGHLSRMSAGKAAGFQVRTLPLCRVLQ